MRRWVQGLRDGIGFDTMLVLFALLYLFLFAAWLCLIVLTALTIESAGQSQSAADPPGEAAEES